MEREPAPVEAVMEPRAYEPPVREPEAYVTPRPEPVAIETPRYVEEAHAPAEPVRPAAPEPEPVREIVAAAPVRPAWKMEPVSLPSDMQMVETASKPAAPVHEEEAPRPVRTPRPRPQQAVIADEPLQQVETRDQDRNGDPA